MARCRSKSRSSDLVAAGASPSFAFSTLDSNASVNPPTADTTTTMRSGDADFTMPATLRKASLSSTDVPPNFMMVGFVDTGLIALCAIIERKQKSSALSRRIRPGLIGNSALSYNLQLPERQRQPLSGVRNKQQPI